MGIMITILYMLTFNDMCVANICDNAKQHDHEQKHKISDITDWTHTIRLYIFDDITEVWISFSFFFFAEGT